MSDPRQRPGEWHRRTYDVPAFIGRRITFQGKPGKITGFRGPYLLAKVESYPHTVPLHPTWRVDYAPTPERTQPPMATTTTGNSAKRRLHGRPPMARKRKPLEWIDVYGTGNALPDCHQCLDWITQPLMAEAVASVGIETGGVNVRRLVESYHEGRHTDDTA